MDTTSTAVAKPGTVPITELKPQQAAAQRKGRRAFAVLGGVVVVAGIATGGYALATAGQETTDDAQVESDVVPVSARVGGVVQKVLVHDNDTVKKGQVLLEIDSADYAARVQQAEAELASAQAQLQVAQAQSQIAEATAKGGLSSAKAMVSGSSVGVSSAQAQVDVAKAALERAKAESHRAKLDMDRTEQLFKAQAATQQQLENAQIAYDSAQAALAQAQAGLSAAEEAKHAAQSRVAEAQGRLTQTEPIDAQINAAHAQADLAAARVKAAEAALTMAKNQLSYAKITAPDDGVVSKLSVHEGQLIGPGTPVGELVPSETYVVANFKETQIGSIKPGQKVTVKIDAFDGRHLEGKVESVSAGTGARFSLLPADNASGNYVKVVQRVPVRISLVDPPKELALRAGLSAEATVFVSK